MTTIRNILFSSAFCLFLIGPALLFVGQEKLAVDLPSWFTAKEADYLAGGLEEARVERHLNLSGFVSEKLQSNLETAINNHVPLKSSVLLGNASLQRSAILASNKLFNHPAVPTFYGSDKIYLPAYNALARMPDDDVEATLKGTAATAAGIMNLAEAYPSIQFCIVVADESNTSEANPAVQLVSKNVTTSDCVETLEDRLENTPNVHVVSAPYTDTTQYYRHYYTTDHHWNGYGTLAVFGKIQTALNFTDSLDNDLSAIEFPHLRINGSCSREGLMFLNEVPREPQFDLSSIQINNAKIPPLASDRPLDTLSTYGEKAEFTFYSSWYGSYQLAAKSPLNNHAAPNKSTAIVIQDSFNNSLHWLLAQNHARLECFSDTKPTDESHTLQERIEATGADTVYLVGNVSAIRRLTDEQPDYFTLDPSKATQ